MEATMTEFDEAAALRLVHWHREGFERGTANTERFVALVSGLDADQLASPVPGLDWRAIDVVAHVASVYRRFTVNRRRASDFREVAQHNADDIAEIGTDADALTADMLAQLELMGSVVDQIDPSHLFEFHAGQPITMAGGWGNMIGELLAHGDDIARATGATWTVDAGDLEPFWRYTSQVMPGWFTEAAKTATDRWELDLGFASGPVRLRFTGGGLARDEPGPWNPDHVVAGDPVAITLAVPYRRRDSDSPEVLALGRRIEPL